MDKKLLNLTELAAHIGIPKRTLYRMVSDGRFPVAPVPGLQPRRWSVVAVDEWLRGEI